MIKIDRLVAGYLSTNSYRIYYNDGGEGYVIDPGYRWEEHVAFIKEHDLNIKGILLTHAHHDHVGAAKKISEAINTPIYIHERDNTMYKNQGDILLKGGEILMLEETEIHVLNMPGHTPGGVGFYLPKEKICFTGDTLFDVDMGFSKFEGGSEKELMWTTQNVLDKLPDDVTIYPGHDVKATMEYVRKQNVDFQTLLSGKERVFE